MKIRRILSEIKTPLIVLSGILFIYITICFFILPVFLKSKLPEAIQQETGRKALISKVQIKPFPLAINIQGFELQEHNGQPFVAIDDFYIEVGLFQSIKKLALAFTEVSFKTPFVHIVRNKDGAFNFNDLFKPQPNDNNAQDTQVLPVDIIKLALSSGRILWEDARFNTSVIEDVDSINIDIESLTTRVDKLARLGLSLELKTGGHMDWEGTASIKPWSSEGHIKLDNIALETIQALTMPETVPFKLKGYELLNANYKVSYHEKDLKFAIKDAVFEIRDFEFFDKNQSNSLIKIPVFSLQGIDFNSENQSLVIESVAANDADFQAWLNAQGVINYQPFFPSSETGNNSSSKTSVNTAEPNTTPLNITIKTIALNNFGVMFENRSFKKPELMTFKPINFKLTNYSSESGSVAPFQLDAVLNKSGLIKLVGDAGIQPFSAKITVDAKKIGLESAQDYINNYINLDVIDGKLNIDGNAVVATPIKDELDFTFKGNAAVAKLILRDPSLKEKNQKKDLVKLPTLNLQGIDFNLGKQELLLDAVTAKDAEFQAWLNPEGNLNYDALLSISDAEKISIEKTVAETVKPQTATWKIKVNTMGFTNFGLNFEDQMQKNPVTMSFKPVNLKLANYSNQSGVSLPVELSVGMNNTGVIALKGNTVISPLSASLNLDTKNIELENFQPYFDKFVRMDVIDGALHIDGNVAVAKQKEDKLDFKFKGNYGVSNLVIRDQKAHKDLVKWDELTFKGVDVDLLGNRYVASELIIDKPYAKVLIRKDKTLNFNNILVADNSKPDGVTKTDPSKPAELGKPYFELGKIKITNGSSDFSDFSLILPFAAQIKNLDGGAVGFSSEQKSKIIVALKGNAYDLAPVDVKGEISPYLGDYNVTVNFNGLPMPLVSPYMVQFAGYKVEKGIMTLGLNYKVLNNELTASNNILIDRFELGEKVENPNAVSLPLELAVALLKDSSGKIKMDVPITGSLNDPQFSLGSIVADALINVISKVITSPFRALGSLADTEKDLSVINFTAGSSLLTKPQQEKLDNLAKALIERPILNLDIKGAAFQEQDWPVIRDDALTDQLKKRRALEINKNTDKKVRDEYVELSDDDYKRLLAEMFIEKFPLLAETSIFGKPQLINSSEGDFYEIAKQKLFTIIKPQPQRLKRLASARAQAIANYIVQQAGVPRERVFILDSVIDPGRKNSEIVTALSLNAGD